jgi:hypothetical protein
MSISEIGRELATPDAAFERPPRGPPKTGMATRMPERVLFTLSIGLPFKRVLRGKSLIRSPRTGALWAAPVKVLSRPETAPGEVIALVGKVDNRLVSGTPTTGSEPRDEERDPRRLDKGESAEHRTRGTHQSQAHFEC